MLSQEAATEQAAVSRLSWGAEVTQYGMPSAAPSRPRVGLASLPVELPLRGSAYHFTTTGGEVTISARAISNAFIRTLLGIATLLAVSGICVGIYYAARSGRLNESSGTAALLILGVVSVALGVLPVLGLALILVGAASWLHRRYAARVAATA